MDLELILILFSFGLAIIYLILTYKIAKEEKFAKDLPDLLLKKNNIRLTIFMTKAILGIIPVKNKSAIWICRLIYIWGICLIPIMLLVHDYLNKN